MSDESRFLKQRLPQLLIASSGLLTLEILIGAVLRFVLRVPSDITALGIDQTFLVGVLTSVPFILALGYAGRWLARHDMRRDRYPRIFYWFLVGGFAFLSVNVPLMALFPLSELVVASWIRWGLSIGLTVGVWVGIAEARTIENTLTKERQKIRMEQLEAQRDLFEYLNSLLRHEVLNTANTIDGYATLLLETNASDTETHHYADVISQQSTDLEVIIEDIRILLRILDGTAEFTPIDLDEKISEETDLLETTYPDVEITVDLPDEAVVYGDSLIRRLFGNLVRNAIEHNNSDVARVAVDGAKVDDSIVITISDNGPGIPEDVRNTLFERPRKAQVNHGLGLYLVGKLVEYYGGRIELVSTDGDGSTFEISFPLAGAEAAAQSEESPRPSGFGLQSELP
ncbi:sensor histidine kinase [Halobellus captivus]|uniref:sensor histidine kinase n=1 Tax=Halobellus captivus TaxID=2592614 RepID=UPI00119CC32A|nr:HAMP domain-containing sensor histidine kinase [Halobellus captivus]